MSSSPMSKKRIPKRVTGQTRRLLDAIIAQRSKGNQTIALATKTKLILKGLNPDKFSLTSEDDPAVLAKVREVAASLNAGAL
jgi:hypothetical protein